MKRKLHQKENALAKSTQEKYKTGKNYWSEFIAKGNYSIDFLSTEVLADFCYWLFTEKKLGSSAVSVYKSAVSTKLSLKGYFNYRSSKAIIQTMTAIKGIKTHSYSHFILYIRRN